MVGSSRSASEIECPAPLEQNLVEVVTPEPLREMTAMDQEDIDPTETPSSDAPTTTLEAITDTPLQLGVFHILKGNVGVGIFLLPMIYNDFGSVMSPLVGLGVGLIVIDCMMMLLSAKKVIARQDVQTYPEVSGFVFGSLMRIVTDAFIIMTQFSFCLMYLQAAGAIFSQLMNFTAAYKIAVIFETLVVIPLCFLSNRLSILAVTSTIATFLVGFCVLGTTIYFVRQLNDSGSAVSTTLAGRYTKWPLFIASNVTVLEGIAIILPVENATLPKDKSAVPKMVRTTMLCIILTYAVYAMLGYSAYGCALQNTSVTVLPLTSFGNALRAGLSINMLFTYPLQFVPAIRIIDAAMGITLHRAGCGSKKAILNRIGINIVISLLALLIGGNAIGLIVAFVGSTASVFIAIVFPALLNLHVEYATEHPEAPRKGKDYFLQMCTLSPNTFRRCKCIAYIVFGLLVFGFGTTSCVVDATNMISDTESEPSTTNAIVLNATCS